MLTPENFIGKHLGAFFNISVDNADFTNKLKKVTSGKDRDVMYCTIFDCDAAQRVTKKLEEAGFDQVYD